MLYLPIKADSEMRSCEMSWHGERNNLFVLPIYSQFLDEEDAESQKFLTNGIMKKKKYEEYHEEYVIF